MRKMLLTLTVCVFAAARLAHGVPIISHMGANDPEFEGWAKSDSGSTVGTAALTPDPGFENAWQINSDAGEISYSYRLSPTEKTDALSMGFVLTGRWRVQTNGSNFNGGNTVGVRLPDGWLQFRMGTGTSVDRRVELFGTTVGTDLGPDAYYTASVIYDPADGKADFFVADTLVQADVAPFPAGLTTIMTVIWGGVNFGDNEGEYNYSLVDFRTGLEPIPEPASMVLMAMGGLLVLVFGVRNRRKR